jgi:hypothetical protein
MSRTPWQGPHCLLDCRALRRTRSRFLPGSDPGRLVAGPSAQARASGASGEQQRDPGTR